MTQNCDCVDKCARWGLTEGENGGFFCPYIPGDDTECKRLTDKTIGPTVKTRSQRMRELGFTQRKTSLPSDKMGEDDE